MQTFSIDDPTIGVRRGERFCIAAPAIPTAGYRWSTDSDASAVAEIESTFDITGTGIGGGTVQRIVLEPRKRGTFRLRLSYWQAGAAAAESVKEIDVTVD